MTEKNNNQQQIQQVQEDEGKTLDVVLRKSEILLKSGMLPKELNTKEKIAVLIMKAKELNMPPLEAISHLFVVNQKVAIDCTGMLALILRSGHAKKIQFGGDGTSAWCEMERKDGVVSFKYAFTIEDARRAGLLSKDGWRGYPKELLLARAISGCARKVFPDVIGGLYTPEELGLDIVPEVPEVPIEVESTSAETTQEVSQEEVAVQEQEGEATIVFEPESKIESKAESKPEPPVVEEEVKEKKEEKPKEKKTEEKRKVEKVEVPSASHRLAKILSVVDKYSSDTIEQQSLVINVKKKLGLKQKVAELSEEDFNRLLEALTAEINERLAKNI